MNYGLVIPEAGGDAGVGVLRMAEALTGDLRPGRVHTLDASGSPPVGGIFTGPVTQHVLPLASAGEAFTRALGATIEALGREHAILLWAPTAEYMTGALIALRDAGALPPLTLTALPSAAGYAASRDKVALAEHLRRVGLGHAALETGAWTPERRFGKPRFGVGSRGCGVVHTQAEADALDGHVFQAVLDGPEYVVDVVHGRALTRLVHRQRGGADTHFTYVSEPALEQLARDVAASLGAPVANVQARRDGDGWRVFDVGTRLSGASCAARLIGVNWLEGLLSVTQRPIDDGGQEWFKPRLGATVQRRFEEVAR
jgi:hypothetical protein